MIAIAHCLGLAIATVFAASAAVLLDWILLYAAFHLMRTAARTPAPAFRPELVHGTRQLARHFDPAARR